MTAKSDFREAYRAGRAAVEKRSLWPTFLAAAVGTTIGRIIWTKFSLSWIEGALISVFLVALLSLLGSLIERRVKTANREDG